MAAQRVAAAVVVAAMVLQVAGGEPARPRVSGHVATQACTCGVPRATGPEGRGAAGTTVPRVPSSSCWRSWRWCCLCLFTKFGGR